MSECILTKYKPDRAGYGKCCQRRFGKKIYLAHRLAWIDANGRLPGPGMKILHRCDNPPCVNPEHLWEGTQAENIADREAKGRGRGSSTHCPREHEFTPENTYVYFDAGRQLLTRQCRTCNRASRERKKAALL